MEINFDPNKISIIDIDKIRPNSWNPKDKDTEEYQKVKKGIKLNGLKLPIIVRENNGFEIIDGEQRWTCCKELGFKRVIIYNEGKIDEKTAKELTLWYQVQIPFNDIKLANFITELNVNYEDLELPYTDIEIGEMEELTNFDWGMYKENANKGESDYEEEARTLKVVLSKSQYEIVMSAISKAKAEGETDSDSRALELICADYLAT